MPFITLKDEVPATKNERPGPRFRLGCGGHAVLLLIALAVSSQLAYRSLVQQAASGGQGMNPDAMGFYLVLFFPFVYLGILVVYKVTQFAVTRVARRARRTPPEGD